MQRSQQIDVSTPATNTLTNVATMNADGQNGDPPPPPAGVTLPFNVLHFTLGNLGHGGSTIVTIELPKNVGANSYWKYGPTPDNSSRHWYDFTTHASFDTEQRPGRVTGGGIQLYDNYTTITLDLKDGQLGDNDLTANGIIDDPGAPAFTVQLTANQHFVAQLYRDLLHRDAEPDGLANWSGLLDQGVSRFQVVLDIENSPEYRMDEVEAAYGRFLNRAADPQGLHDAVHFLAAGGTVEQLESILVASPEYFAKRAGGSSDGFLTALYQDALQRNTDPSGELTWKSVQARSIEPAASRAMMAALVLSSPEEERRQVESSYERFLHRAADASGIDASVRALARGLSDEVLIAALCSSEEYTARL